MASESPFRRPTNGLDWAALDRVVARFERSCWSGSWPLIDDYLTLTSPQAAEAAELVGRPRVLPVHTDGWAHFTQDGESFRAAYRAAGLADLLLSHEAGVAVAI